MEKKNYDMNKKNLTIDTSSKFIGIPPISRSERNKIPESVKWQKKCIGSEWNYETCREITGRIAVNPSNYEKVYLCLECLKKFPGYVRQGINN